MVDAGTMSATEANTTVGGVAYMPFVSGYMRVPGRFGYMKGSDLAGMSGGGGYEPDTLASYRPCSQESFIAGEFRMNNTVAKTTADNQDYLDAYHPWGEDCNVMLHSQCQQNYTAVVKTYDWLTKKLTYLLECVKCPDNSVTPAAGLYEQCTCQSGSAHQVSLCCCMFFLYSILTLLLFFLNVESRVLWRLYLGVGTGIISSILIVNMSW